MRFIADLHIHSRFSMATASDLTLENLFISARKKGITVVGTGDFTHPEWFAEMKERLVPAEPGLFRLRPDLEKICEDLVPFSCRGPVRFMLQAEVSSIYKKDGKVRKNHNLLYFPSFGSVARFNTRLSSIGNIKSDGRPILGLDSRDLLEILLETDDSGFLIPAHIWTPWFSLLGSKSGFNSIKECFGDLSDHIFAAETGLSSDPAMNHMVSFLDGITLVSNSDAHSPGKLGREANLFNTDLSYSEIKASLETGAPDSFLGTLEFFPEEGKYHMDGHRKCGVRLSPAESIKLGGICPECGGKMTLGVLYRVEELADRHDGSLPDKAKPYQSIIPLNDILAEILQVGVSSKKVKDAYSRITSSLGPELEILHSLDIEKINSIDFPLLGLAIKKMRNHEIVLLPGYDGEFGTVKIFTDDERRAASGQTLFFETGKTSASFTDCDDLFKFKKKLSSEKKQPEIISTDKENKRITEKMESSLPSLNSEQERAVMMRPCNMLITAGPGTGKTRTITYRIEHLISESGFRPSEIVAVTFTNKAAEEMRHRLENLLPGKELPFTGTFHSLCFSILKDAFPEKNFCVIDNDQREIFLKTSLEKASEGKSKKNDLKSFSEFLGINKTHSHEKNDSEQDKWPVFFPLAKKIYQDLLDKSDLLDFDDLMYKSKSIFYEKPDFLEKWHKRIRYLFIDEYQDLNPDQYSFIKLIASESCNVCAIGDPDQSIYGFRGGSSEFFSRFTKDFTGSEELRLIKNYRSSRTILDASFQMIRKGENSQSERVFSDIEAKKSISIYKGSDEYRESSHIASEIEKLVGGTTSLSIHTGKANSDNTTEYAFSDIAILSRTRSQADFIMTALDRACIPYENVNSDDFRKQQGVRLSVEILKASLGLENTISETTLSFNFLDLKNISDSAISGKLISAIEESKDLLVSKGHLNLSSDFKGWDRFIEIASPFSDPYAFLSEMALMDDQDVYTKKAQKVSILTLHASKGLEFPVVFITGCENGLIPYERKGAESDIEEERRLFFVGMTRAKERLYLSWASKRTVFGKKTERIISPFLEDIEKKLLEHSGFTKQMKKETEKLGGTQLELF